MLLMCIRLNFNGHFLDIICPNGHILDIYFELFQIISDNKKPRKAFIYGVFLDFPIFC